MHHSIRGAIIILVASSLSSSVSASYYLRREIVEKAYYGARFALLAFTKDLVEKQHENNVEAWSDEVKDQALVGKEHNTCYASFCSTSMKIFGPRDFAQNLDLRQVEFSECLIRRGFYKAYDAEYIDLFTESLDRCLNSCLNVTGSHCDLVLAGHSQGGAAAISASLKYSEDYNTTVITFGAPTTVQRPCRRIQEDNHYRFINSIPPQMGVLDETLYDLVPNLPGLGAEHFGHTFILSGEDNPVAYVGMNNMQVRLPTDIFGFVSHEMTLYLERMEHLYLAGSDIPGTGWEEGHLCGYDDECMEGYTCQGGVFEESRCRPIEPTCNPCENNDDCGIGQYCTRRAGTQICVDAYGQTGIDCPCSSAVDCTTGRCGNPLLFFRPRDYRCVDKLPTGDACREDADCISNRCEGFFRRTCD